MYSILLDFMDNSIINVLKYNVKFLHKIYHVWTLYVEAICK
jgi:hypothetical protein